jgi:hypothetical protein
MSLELILEQVELQDNKLNDNTFDVFFDSNTNLIHAFENDVKYWEIREFVYKLTDEQDTIAKNHRQEILEYCLAKVTADDEVSLGDIFLHGKFVELVAKN